MRSPVSHKTDAHPLSEDVEELSNQIHAAHFEYIFINYKNWHKTNLMSSQKTVQKN